MKKWIFVLAALLLFSLVACRGGSELIGKNGSAETDSAEETMRTEYLLSEEICGALFGITPAEFLKEDTYNLIFEFSDGKCEDFREHAEVNESGYLVVHLSEEQKDTLYAFYGGKVEDLSDVDGVTLGENYSEITITGNRREVTDIILKKLSEFTFQKMLLEQLYSGVKTDDLNVRIRIVDKSSEKVIYDLNYPRDGGFEFDSDALSFTERTSKTYELKKSHSIIKSVGRSSVVASGIACDNTASGIEFSVDTESDVTVSVSSVNSSGKPASSYFTVYIDGERANKRYHVSGAGKIVISGLKEGAHEIRIIKQTEAAHSLCVFKSIKLVGELGEKPEDRELYIEILGDSVAAAYGNMIIGNNYTNPSNKWGGSAEYQDATRAFPFLTAEKLGADVSVIGYSGIGLTVCSPPFTVEDYYLRTSYLRSRDTMFDFENARVPDVIVMDLAQNDYNTNKGAKMVVKKARELIENTRRLYGEEVTIVWTHDMNGGCYSAEIKQLIEDMGGAEKSLYTFKLPENFDGADTHPSAAAHENSAKLLSSYIKRILKKQNESRE